MYVSHNCLTRYTVELNSLSSSNRSPKYAYDVLSGPRYVQMVVLSSDVVLSIRGRQNLTGYLLVIFLPTMLLVQNEQDKVSLDDIYSLKKIKIHSVGIGNVIKQSLLSLYSTQIYRPRRWRNGSERWSRKERVGCSNPNRNRPKS